MSPSSGMAARLADMLPLSPRRVPILAEYPYYRADPTAWTRNLRTLREFGADVITAYVPWRLHELGPSPAGGHRYDFHGHSHPQRDLLGFIDQAARAGLLVILKPGPYINGEVRLGGLPDRVTGLPSRRSAAGDVVTVESLPMPSAYDEAFAHAAIEWLGAFREHVVEPWPGPDSPIAGLQIGNEGIFGELHATMDAEDFSAAALGRQAEWAADAPSIPTDPVRREQWASWSGRGIRGILGTYRDALGSHVPVLHNLPLPGLPGPRRTPEAWVMRSSSALPDGVAAGNTSWAGNASSSDEALAALWLGMRLHRTDCLEENWGFTWADESYAHPSAPLYNVLLGLAFGSSVISVYTACTAHHWAPGIGPDDEALRAEGHDPAHYAPPYCPGAPLDESGEVRPNASAMRLLDVFSDWAGGALRRVRPSPEAWLVVDPVAVAESAWPVGPDDAACPAPTPMSAAVAASMRWMLRDHVEVDLARRAGGRVSIHGGDSGTATWLVVGGRSMGRETQRELAELVIAGQRCVVVGPVPEWDEAGKPCDLLDRALRASPAEACVVPLAAEVGTTVSQVADVLSRGSAGEIGDVLVLRRHDAETETTVIYLFSRSDTAREVGDDLLDSGISLRLAPYGAAVLVIVAGRLRCFLVHAGAGKEKAALLRTGAGDPVVSIREHTAGRRSSRGWQMWSGGEAPIR